jgi:hypothetical protein
MTRAPVWKKTQAAKAAQEIAQEIARAFNVPAPVITLEPEWEYRIAESNVWTHAGAARLSVSIDARFAHLAFRFHNPARAVPFDDATGRLNRFSGKWNRIATPSDWFKDGKPSPQDSIDMFAYDLRKDFAQVAQPNPNPDEVAAHEVEEHARRALWAQHVLTGV